MEHHQPDNGGPRRPEGRPMPKRIEWTVTPSPVRDADRRCSDPHRARIAELHRQVRDGVYDSVTTLEAVARRILQSGDL